MMLGRVVGLEELFFRGDWFLQGNNSNSGKRSGVQVFTKYMDPL